MTSVWSHTLKHHFDHTESTKAQNIFTSLFDSSGDFFFFFLTDMCVVVIYVVLLGVKKQPAEPFSSFFMDNFLQKH